MKGRISGRAAPASPSNDLDALAAAGLASDEVNSWRRAEPGEARDFARDRKSFSRYWRKSRLLLDRLPLPARRSAPDRSAAECIEEAARGARVRFLRKHCEAIYEALTNRRSRFLRVDELVAAAARLVPGLVPSSEEIAADHACLQKEKLGVEIDHGLFLSAVLACGRAGRHLCHAMLLPRREAEALRPQFEKDGKVELGRSSVERRGKSAVVTFLNSRFLNAEDQTTLDDTEVCVDLALLDPAVEVGVLRGCAVEHPKYAGRRVFGAGINLTHLYNGRIPFLWYLRRDLGYVNKLYRGLAFADDLPPDEFGGRTLEKPWIAAVETFAIGGHCQLLLAVDYVLAERNAFMTLPARKEGIIPGAANLRLPRLTGDRIARQAIQYERRLECASPEGRLICDEVVEAGGMDAAIEQVVGRLTNSGVVSTAANRRAFRIAQEPLDAFRNYFSVYAREQAYCHFSPALISNLERYWSAQDRRP